MYALGAESDGGFAPGACADFSGDVVDGAAGGGEDLDADGGFGFGAGEA